MRPLPPVRSVRPWGRSLSERAPRTRAALRVPAGSAPRYVPESPLWSGLPQPPAATPCKPLFPVSPALMARHDSPQSRVPSPVVERPRSTTAAGIAPTARRGAAGPSNRAATPTNRLPRPCRGAPPLHDTIPACRRGAPTSPRLHPMARTGADHDSVARSPHNVVAMLCGAPRGVDRRGGGSPRTSLGPGPGVRIAPGGRSRRHESRRRTASSGIRGRRGRPEFPDSGERPYRPESGTLGETQHPGLRMMPPVSVIRDAGRDSASRITDEDARFPNPGR